jgi:hypothetical protein
MVRLVPGEEKEIIEAQVNPTAQVSGTRFSFLIIKTGSNVADNILSRFETDERKITLRGIATTGPYLKALNNL